MRALASLFALPLSHAFALTKQSPRTFFANTSGLSKSHVANGGLMRLKPQRLSRALRHGLANSKSKALANGWSAEEFEATQKSMPRLSNGATACLAAFVHILQNPSTASLPLARAYALEIDELLSALCAEVDADDPGAFRDAVLEFVIADAVNGEDEVEATLLGKWVGCATWEDLSVPFAHLADMLAWDVYAALDAEWSSRFFETMEPQPTLLWVAARLNPGITPAVGKRQRNAVFRPVRRMLEFSFALAEYAYLGRWPRAKPGRSSLSEVMDLSDADVGNFFDDTRRISFDECQHFWETMCKQVRFQRRRHGIAPFPGLLAGMAIHWQRTMLTTQLGREQVHVLDEDFYRARWATHRERWRPSLPSGTKNWPNWLLEQTVRPVTQGTVEVTHTSVAAPG